MKKVKINNDRSRRKVKSPSRKTVLRKFHTKSQQGKYPIKYLSNNILAHRYGVPIAVDLFNAIDQYQIEDQNKCEECGKHSILIAAELYETVIPVRIEFEEEDEQWKIDDISFFKTAEDDEDSLIKQSFFDDLQTPEEFIKTIFHNFTSSVKQEYIGEVSPEIEKVEGYSEIIYSFLLGIKTLNIIETQDEDDYECRLIIEGKDSSVESRVEIQLHRFINDWLISDIRMPKDLPDGSKGELRSIFGFEQNGEI